MTTLFQGQATYRFSPPLNKRGDTTRRDGKSTQWWLILDCDREISRYFRHLFATHYHHTQRLQEPLWGSHISVIRDEKPPYLKRWKELEGESITFQYANDVTVHEQFAVVSVRCEAALDYRESLGLPREPEYPLHLTIGNLQRL